MTTIFVLYILTFNQSGQQNDAIRLDGPTYYDLTSCNDRIDAIHLEEAADTKLGRHEYKCEAETVK